jgi:hypothetical protein
MTPGDRFTHLDGALFARPCLDAQPKSAPFAMRLLAMKDLTCA